MSTVLNRLANSFMIKYRSSNWTAKHVSCYMGTQTQSLSLTQTDWVLFKLQFQIIDLKSIQANNEAVWTLMRNLKKLML